MVRFLYGIVILGLTIAACSDQTYTESDTGAALHEASLRLEQADSEPHNWLSHGNTYAEQRFSSLTQINTDNIDQLGLTWSFDLDTNRGQEATPLIVDGVMYVTTAWSMVKALDARSGTLLWSYDPEVDPRSALNACCDVVNRGAAYWNDRVYIGTLDGRLVALSAKTGQVLWDVKTIDPDTRYTITGAPRVVKGNVIIGNGGGELGVRGYVSAYDGMTGERVWRFHTVPGNPADGFENEAMRMAAETWTGEWWTLGGGGTVWDSIAYDPDLELLYVGVGNGSPWNQKVRSPDGGDNLFLSSIVALRPETGEYVWHFQSTPGETWDYTATQQMTLADLDVDGTTRKVLMQAPKNGFFYVLDRETGEFLSGAPFAIVTWATGLDETGRPIESPTARYYDSEDGMLVFPGSGGAHNWNSMAYSPDTGLVYIPVEDAPTFFKSDEDFEPSEMAWNLGVDFDVVELPIGEEQKRALLGQITGHLLAWDPIEQREVWRVQYDGPGSGGTLATAGGLVFQGTAAGAFSAYDAASGQLLWAQDAQTGIVAAPVSYAIDEEQYVSIVVGWGGAFGVPGGEMTKYSANNRNISRVLTFKLGGKAKLPPVSDLYVPTLDPPAASADPVDIASGKSLYNRYCVVCHGFGAASAGIVPDLRYSAFLSSDAWFDIVLDGLLEQNGMVSFASELDRQAAQDIRAYVVNQANLQKAAIESSSSAEP